MSDDFEIDLDAASGQEYAKRVADENRTAFGRINFFRVEPGKPVIVRFLTDLFRTPDSRLPAIVTYLRHSNIPTIPDPNNDKRPKSMPAICRNDKSLKKHFSGGCPICDRIKEDAEGESTKPWPQTMGLVVIRKEITKGGTAIEDVTQDGDILVPDPDKPGEFITTKGQVPVVELVQQSGGNFWDVIAGSTQRLGSIVTDDYEVDKSVNPSNKRKVTWTFAPVRTRPAFDLRDDAELLARYPLSRYPGIPSLADMVKDQVGDSRYSMFFEDIEDPRAGKDSGGRPAGKGATASRPAARTNEPDATTKDRWQDMITSQVAGQGAAPAVDGEPPF